MSHAFLLNWFDLPEEGQAAFDKWHNRQHVIERLCIPGFETGRRYASIDTPVEKGHGYLVIYDTESLQILESSAYAARLDAPTPLTRSVVPMLRDLTRTVGELVQERGTGLGSFLRTIRLPDLSDWIVNSAPAVSETLNRMYEVDSITRVQLYRPDARVTHFKDKTQEGRSTDTLRKDDYPWGIVVEGCRPMALDVATEELRRALEGQGVGKAARMECHSYQVVFSMKADEARLVPEGLV